MSRLSLNQVRAEALFAWTVQPSDQPTAAQVQAAIMQTVRRLGCRGCAAQMAQEFGDTPDTALIRMRWARGAVGEVFSIRPAGTSAPMLGRQGGSLAAVVQIVLRPCRRVYGRRSRCRQLAGIAILVATKARAHPPSARPCPAVTRRWSMLGPARWTRRKSRRPSATCHAD
jgi:hypothetical protein